MPLIPGTFPSEYPNPVSIDQNLDSQILDQFQKSEFIVSKSRNQRLLLTHLASTVYLLTGYVFIKWCHSACILPLILNVLVQFALSVPALTDPSTPDNTFLDACNHYLTENESLRNVTFARNKIVSSMNGTVFISFFLSVLYHVLFVAWLHELATEDRLADLINGSWWFVSFIGESIPESFSLSSPFAIRMWQLGLYQLLFFDTIILIIQLVIFQAIWRQSTKSLIGQPLDANELETLRPANSAVLGTSLQSIPNTTDILRVRLFDCFSWQDLGS